MNPAPAGWFKTKHCGTAIVMLLALGFPVKNSDHHIDGLNSELSEHDEDHDYVRCSQVYPPPFS